MKKCLWLIDENRSRIASHYLGYYACERLYTITRIIDKLGICMKLDGLSVNTALL